MGLAKFWGLVPRPAPPRPAMQASACHTLGPYAQIIPLELFLRWRLQHSYHPFHGRHNRRYHHHHHHHYHQQQQQQQHHHSAKAEWCDRWCLFVSRSFVLSVCEQDYCKSNQPICLKLDVVIGPTNRKNWLAVDGDPVRDTDSWLLFHFGHHWRIGDLTHGTVTSTTVTRHVGERL